MLERVDPWEADDLYSLLALPQELRLELEDSDDLLAPVNDRVEDHFWQVAPLDLADDLIGVLDRNKKFPQARSNNFLLFPRFPQVHPRVSSRPRLLRPKDSFPRVHPLDRPSNSLQRVQAASRKTSAMRSNRND